MFNPVQFFEYGKQDRKPVVFTIDTTKVLSGSSSINQFKIPLAPNYPQSLINFIVNWGDGNVSRVANLAELTHTYTAPGVYQIKIVKAIARAFIEFDYGNNPAERLKLLEFEWFGDISFIKNAFLNCINLKLNTVKDIPNLSSPLFFNNPFWGCNFEKIKNLHLWEFKCTRFNWMAYQNANFNQDLFLDLSKATEITGVIGYCNNFNSPIHIVAPLAKKINGLIFNSSKFNNTIIIHAPEVEDLSSAFHGATAFNQDVSTLFDWSKVKNLTNFMSGKTSGNYNPLFYDNLLNAWVNGGVYNVSVDMGSIKYTSSGMTARNILTSRGWTITDGGQI